MNNIKGKHIKAMLMKLKADGKLYIEVDGYLDILYYDSGAFQFNADEITLKEAMEIIRTEADRRIAHYYECQKNEELVDLLIESL